MTTKVTEFENEAKFYEVASRQIYRISEIYPDLLFQTDATDHYIKVFDSDQKFLGWIA